MLLQKRLSTWLLTIAANVCRTELQRRSRRAECSWEGLEGQAAPGSVEASALQRLDEEAVYRALGLLSAEHRLVVVLFYYEGMSQPEIAWVCGCVVGTVKSRLHYALARLRRLLGPAGSENEERVKP